MSWRTSLTAALFLRMTLLLALIVVAIGALTYSSAREKVDELYDSQLIVAANVLRALMIDELSERKGNPSLSIEDGPLLSAEDRAAFNEFADWRMFRIWRRNQLALGSDTGPAMPAPAAGEHGFTTILSHGAHWRIYTLDLPQNDMSVQVGERIKFRNVLIQRTAWEMILPLVLAIPASLVLIWFTLNNGLAAVRRLTTQLSRRNVRDLEPLNLTEWPSDLSPLLRAINLLFSRVARTFEQERRFVDHAAHQLRTPLAGLKLQAQLIAREQDPAERAVQAAQLQDAVDRAAHLIEQLLALARLDETAPAEDSVCDLDQIVASVVTDFAPAAASRNVRFAFEGQSAPVKGDAAAVRLIVANLLENAMHHAPPGSEVRALLSVDGAHGVLTVLDDGPGIPKADRQKVFERFFQGKNSEPGHGFGLGLAITAEAARTLGASVELNDRESGKPGLAARVRIPQARASVTAGAI